MNAWIDRLLDMGLAADAACWDAVRGCYPEYFCDSVGAGVFAGTRGGGLDFVLVYRIDISGPRREGYGFGSGSVSGNGYGFGCGYGGANGDGHSYEHGYRRMTLT